VRRHIGKGVTNAKLVHLFVVRTIDKEMGSDKREPDNGSSACTSSRTGMDERAVQVRITQ
jgi:hypothetical protein